MRKVALGALGFFILSLAAGAASPHVASAAAIQLDPTLEAASMLQATVSGT